MIDLKGHSPFGEGARRIVFEHPEDPNRCIKLLTPAAEYKTWQQQAFERERYYLQFYERRGRSMAQLSRYHGAVETSRGAGDIFDLVRDPDGSVSRTLAHHLENGLALADCRGELDALHRYLLAEGIVLADLHAGNLARQLGPDGTFRLVVIDGVGNNDFLKVADYLKPFARAKIERKWRKFEAKLAGP